MKFIGGRGGIRTHGTIAGTPVFKIGALNHSDARPTLLKLSESLVTTNKPLLSDAHAIPEPPAVQNSSSGTIAFRCMGKKNACAHQAHHCCNCLDHRTNPLRPCSPQNESTVAQSKRFTGRNRRSVVGDDLVQQIV